MIIILFLCLFAVRKSRHTTDWSLVRISFRETQLQNKYTYNEEAGEDVIAYVLDTGINITGESSENLINGVDFTGTDFADNVGHGSIISGIIKDVAPNVEIISVKVYDPKMRKLSLSLNLFNGINWAVNDALEKGNRAVINISCGFYVHQENSFTQKIHKAIEKAKEHGIEVVVSAGNYNMDVMYERLSNNKDVITVGAVTTKNTIESNSNYGSGIDIFAPGQNIRATCSGTQTLLCDGTSYAAAYVTGVAVLFASLGIIDLKQTIIDTATLDAMRFTNGSPNRILYNKLEYDFKNGRSRAFKQNMPKVALNPYLRNTPLSLHALSSVDAISTTSPIATTRQPIVNRRIKTLPRNKVSVSATRATVSSMSFKPFAIV